MVGTKHFGQRDDLKNNFKTKKITLQDFHYFFATKRGLERLVFVYTSEMMLTHSKLMDKVPMRSKYLKRRRRPHWPEDCFSTPSFTFLPLLGVVKIARHNELIMKFVGNYLKNIFLLISLIRCCSPRPVAAFLCLNTELKGTESDVWDHFIRATAAPDWLPSHDNEHNMNMVIITLHTQQMIGFANNLVNEPDELHLQCQVLFTSVNTEDINYLWRNVIATSLMFQTVNEHKNHKITDWTDTLQRQRSLRLDDVYYLISKAIWKKQLHGIIAQKSSRATTTQKIPRLILAVFLRSAFSSTRTEAKPIHYKGLLRRRSKRQQAERVRRILFREGLSACARLEVPRNKKTPWFVPPGLFYIYIEIHSSLLSLSQHLEQHWPPRALICS